MQMEDTIRFLSEWNTTSIIQLNGRCPKVCWQMEDDLKFLGTTLHWGVLFVAFKQFL